ncbi:MAG: hypothetical protein MHM6MM_004940 [Cercozoa sp. M6MM]
MRSRWLKSLASRTRRALHESWASATALSSAEHSSLQQDSAQAWSLSSTALHQKVPKMVSEDKVEQPVEAQAYYDPQLRNISPRRIVSALRHVEDLTVTQIREAVVVQLGDVSCETELPRTVVFLRQGSMVSVGCSASECWQLRTKLLMSLGRESTSSWAEAWTVLELRQAPGLADVNKAFHMHRDGTLSLQTASPEVLAVVAHVLGTSECLQHFERLIDGTLTRIDHVNQEVLNTGAISGTKHDLMRLLAQVDMDLSRLIRETPRMPRVVWEHSELEELWDQLREEYDVVDRFERLQNKAGKARDSLQFLVECMHANKSDTLDWCIIALLCIEICLCANTRKARRRAHGGNEEPDPGASGSDFDATAGCEE